MNPAYKAIIAEIPEVNELKNVLCNTEDKARAYESTIVAVYRQGQGRDKTSTGEDRRRGIVNPRVDYEMTEEDLKEILDACKPVPVIMVGNYVPSSPQENANRAWEALGKKMGFDYMTVRPGSTQRTFTAVPSETEPQRAERLKREAKEKRDAEIERLRDEIAERRGKLDKLLTGEGGQS